MCNKHLLQKTYKVMCKVFKMSIVTKNVTKRDFGKYPRFMVELANQLLLCYNIYIIL